MSETAVFKFRLYVAGDAQNSIEALSNLRNICVKHLADRHEIEVVDVFLHPRRALVDGIFMTPTLVRTHPPSTRKIVGTLNQTRTVLQALELPGVVE